MKTFLVIDDDANRLNSYRKLFDFVNIEYAATTEQVKSKIPKCDGYLVDIMYDEPCYIGLTFKNVVELLPEGKPIFIISNKWNEAMDGIKMQYLVQSSKYKNVLGYLSWDKISSDINEIVKDFILVQFNNYYNLAFEAFEKNQDITILQLSDLEFGNKEHYDYIETCSSSLISNVRADLRKLGVRSGKVDFIAVCGDVAYEAKKDQYKQAIKWLRELGKQLLENEDYSRFIIVPGNHDYEFAAAAGNHFEFGCDESKKRVYVKRKKIESDYNNLGMYNFARFIYDLTGDDSFIMDPNKPFINRKYENYGINFILLNPIRIDENLNFDYKLEDNYVSSIIDIFSDVDTEKVTNIALSHINYDKYSMWDKTSDATCTYIKELVEDARIKVWLYGHAHDDAVIDDRTIGKYKVLVSRSNSVMLSGKGRCDEAQNGYTLLHFVRKNNKIVEAQFLQNDSSIKKINSPFKKI